MAQPACLSGVRRTIRWVVRTAPFTSYPRELAEEMVSYSGAHVARLLAAEITRHVEDAAARQDGS